jgi:hypothetical protein
MSTRPGAGDYLVHDRSQVLYTIYDIQMVLRLIYMDG